MPVHIVGQTGFRIILIACATALGGCFFGGGSKACHKPQEYHTSAEAPPLIVPEDLDPPERDGALVIGGGPRATEPIPKNQPCLEEPPDYFGRDSDAADDA
jgi:hypothetical protein